MPDCSKCRYAANDHIAGNYVCMYMGPEGCDFEEKEDAPQENKEEKQAHRPIAAGTPLLSPEPHLGPREPMHGDAFVEFVDE